MDQHPLVSVVIATFNMATYLPEAVRSVLDQTHANLEVLVVDDGSTDATAEAVAPLLADPRVRYIPRERRGGQAAAKNTGVAAARGEFIAFLDADDRWAPDKLALQIPLFERSPEVGVVYARLAYLEGEGRPLRVADNELFRGRVSGPLLVRNFIGFGTSVVRRECFERMGGFKEAIAMGIDYDLWLRLSTRYAFDYVDRPLLHYRVWPGQMSNNCRGRYLNGIAIMKGFLSEFPGLVERRVEREAWANTYVGMGQCLHASGRGLVAALAHYARALAYRPAYLPAWKSIAKALLHAR